MIYKMELDPETHITATCGCTEAMLAALMVVCNPGEKVITFSPFYETYGTDSISSLLRDDQAYRQD